MLAGFEAQKMIDECELIPGKVFERVNREFIDRLANCQKIDGDNFGHLKVFKNILISLV